MMEIGSVEEMHETAVGGVWAIAQVEAETEDAGWTVKSSRRDRKIKKGIGDLKINAVRKVKE